MKTKIQELINQHKNSKNEVNSLLEELSQIDSSKLSYQEIDSLETSKVRLFEGIYLYRI